MNLKVKREHFAIILKNFGWEGLLNHIQNMVPQLGIYSVSQDWIKDNKYVCKAKGVSGDLLISFL